MTTGEGGITFIEKITASDPGSKNLLGLWPRLSEEDHKRIKFAMNNCDPSRCNLTADAYPLLKREVVIDALLKANRVYGTAVHTTVEKLRQE